jgi:hypothetical protein
MDELLGGLIAPPLTGVASSETTGSLASPSKMLCLDSRNRELRLELSTISRSLWISRNYTLHKPIFPIIPNNSLDFNNLT